MRVLALFAVLSAFASCPALCAEPEPDAAAAARAFWSALGKADFAGLEKGYADKVELRAGSELLKPDWGIAQEGDRTKGKILTREELIKGYKSMIGKLGVEKWRAVFGALKEDRISMETATSGHLVLTVMPGPGGDRLVFEFARDKGTQHWLVVAEHTDY